MTETNTTTNPTNRQCDEEKVCSMMLKSSLKRAVFSLSYHAINPLTCKPILESLVNTLSTYNCNYCNPLLERIKWVSENICSKNDCDLCGHASTIHMLCEEIEAFVGAIDD